MSTISCRILLSAAILAAAFTPGCRRSPEEKLARYMEAGRKQMEKQDYARAVLEFKNAVRIAPKQPDPQYELGLAFLASGDVKSGIALIRKTLELNPQHAGAQLKLAQLMAVAGDKEIVQEAEKRARDLLARAPDNPDVLDVLAMAELQLGKPEDAERHLEEALKKVPQRLRSSVALAKIRLARKDVAGAEEVLKNAAAQTPPSAQAAVALGQFYVAMKRPQEAEAQFRRALGIDAKNADALTYLAGILARTGRSDETASTVRTLSTVRKDLRPAYGLYLFQSGKRDAAIAEFERLAKEDPADRNVRSRLVAAYAAVGRKGDAERILTSALKQNAKDVDALLGRSKLYLLAGQYEEAQKDVNQVIRYRADSAEAHFVLAQVQERRGAELSQRQELAEALKLDPKLVEARIRLARLLIASNAAKAALELMEQAPESQKNIPAVAAQHTWALLAVGDKARARKEIDAALAVFRRPEFLVQDAVLKIDAKQYPQARASLDEALRANPANVQAVDLIARTYGAQGQAAAGLDKVRQYAEKTPGSARLQNLLGEWLAGSGKREEARKAYVAALALDPKLAAARLALALFDLQDGKVEAARKSLAAMIAESPNAAPARLLAAAAEDKAGNRPGAVEQYRRVLEFDPQNVPALNNLAFLLGETGQPDEALKYAQQAKELAPASAAVDDTLGWIFYRKGIYYSAVKHLESAAREPSATRKYHLAMAYLKSGDEKRGRRALEESLKLDPNLAEAKAAKVDGTLK